MKLHEISNNTSLTSAQTRWLASAIIGTYEVVDGKIDVEGYVSMPSDTTSFLVQFGKVTGNFSCAYTKITSLEGGPRTVGGHFSCADTPIASLAGSPSEVGGDFGCAYTKITSLEGIPSKVGGSFSCSHTKIALLEGCPSKVGGNFLCSGTPITSLVSIADNITQMDGAIWVGWDKIESGGLGLVLIPGLKELMLSDVLTEPFKIIKKYLNKPDLIFDCQQELIEAGFEEYAQL